MDSKIQKLYLELSNFDFLSWNFIRCHFCRREFQSPLALFRAHRYFVFSYVLQLANNHFLSGGFFIYIYIVIKFDNTVKFEFYKKINSYVLNIFLLLNSFNFIL